MLSIREKKVLFATSDVFLICLAGFLSFVLVAAVSPSSPQELMNQMVWVAFSGCVLFTTASLNDCLDVTSLNSRSRYLRRWGISWTITFVIYLFVFFLLGRPETMDQRGQALPRLIPTIFCFIALFALPAGRALIDRILGFGNRKKACIVVGAGGSGRHFVEDVASINEEWEVLALIDDDQAKLGTSICGVPVTGDCSQLLPLVEKYDVQEVVLAITREMSREVIDSLMVCFERGIDVVPVLMATERTLGRVPINHLGDKWLPTTFWASSSMPLFYRVIKRALDVFVSLLLMLATLPVLLVAVLATKAGSRGPALYFQNRVGVRGRLFRIVKIRTMVENAEAAGAQWALQNDKRITLVGRLLRATRIDELPQLWNILCGDMSLIGPRPERPEFIQSLAAEIPYYRARLCVRPGLTGWAQIMYRYGNSVDDARIKLEYDLYYIKNRSVLLDLSIGLRTLKTILLMKGT